MMAIRHRGNLPHIHLRIQPILSLLAIRQLKNPQPSHQAAIVRRPLTVFSATPRAASSEVQLHGKNSCGQVTHQPTWLTIPFDSNAAGPIPRRAKHCRWQSQGQDRVALVPKAVSQSLCRNPLSENFVEIGHFHRDFDKVFRQRLTTKLRMSHLGQALEQRQVKTPAYLSIASSLRA